MGNPNPVRRAPRAALCFLLFASALLGSVPSAATDLLVCGQGGIRRFNLETGAEGARVLSTLGTVRSMAWGPDANLYCALGGRIVVADPGGRGILRTFATLPAEVSGNVAGLAFGSEGDLYGRADQGSFRFDGKTGAYLGALDSPPGAENWVAWGFVIGPGGFLLANDPTRRAIRRYRPTSCEYLDDLMIQPRDSLRLFAIARGPDGDLYAIDESGQVLRYEGSTGASKGVLPDPVRVGSGVSVGLRFAPGNQIVAWDTAQSRILSFTPGAGQLPKVIDLGAAMPQNPYDVLVDPSPLPPTRHPSGLVSPTASSVEVTPAAGVPADGASSATVTITLRDREGKPVPGVPVLFRSSLGRATQPPAPTNSEGVAVGKLTGTAVGTGTLSAFADPGPGYTGLSSHPTVTFTGAPTTKVRFLTQPETLVVGRPMQMPLQVRLLDAEGNQVTTSGVLVTLALGPGFPDAKLSGDVSAVTRGGVAIFERLTVDRPGRSLVLWASAEGLESGWSNPFDVVPAPTDLLLQTGSDALRYELGTGRQVGSMPDGFLRSLTYGPDGSLYGLTNSYIQRIDGLSGDSLPSPYMLARGQFDDPYRVFYGPDGHLYALAYDLSLHRFHGTSGAYMGKVVECNWGAGEEFLNPTFGPDGELYGSACGGDIERRSRVTGELLGVFASNPTGTGDVSALCFGPDGNLYVTDGYGPIRKVDGKTGDLLGDFTQAGAGQDRILAMVFGADGDLYAYSTQPALSHFDGKTGTLKGAAPAPPLGWLQDFATLLSMGAPLPPFPPTHPFDRAKSTWSFEPEGISPHADGLEPLTVKVSLKDAGGLPLAGQPVGLVSSGTANSFQPAIAITDDQGQARLRMTSTVAERKTLNAVWNPGPGQVYLDEPKWTIFGKPAPGPAVRLVVEVSSETATAGVVGSFRPIVRVTDSQGRSANTARVPVKLSLAGGPASAVLGGLTLRLMGDGYPSGEAVYSDMSLDRAGEGYRFRAEMAGFPPAESAPFNVRPRAPWDLVYIDSYRLRRLDGVTGASVGEYSPSDINDCAVGPGGDLFLATGSGSILRQDVTGRRSVFVPMGAGRMGVPRSLAFGPDGNLYVGCYGPSSAGSPAPIFIRRFSGRTGAYLGDLVPSIPGAQGMVPRIAFGPDGLLYVALPGKVGRFQPGSGLYLGDVVTWAGSSSHSSPDLAFGPEGDLYVSGSPRALVGRFSPSTGAYLGAALPALALRGGTLHSFAVGPDGDLYLSMNGLFRLSPGTGQMRQIGTEMSTGFVRIAGPGLPAAPPERQPSSALSRLTAYPLLDVRADGADFSTVAARVVGPDGSPLAGIRVTLVASGAGATILQPTTLTDASGGVSAKLISTVAGQKVVTAVVGEGAAGVTLPTSVTVAYTSAAPPADGIYRAVYRDPTRSLALTTGAGADKLTSYLRFAGYRQVNSAELAAFLADRVADRKPSVLVMANDIAPDTVMPATDAGTPSGGGLLMDYLRLAGGKVVWPGGTPGHWQAPVGGGTLAWGADGALSALGVWLGQAFPGSAAAATITDAGKAWGLTESWGSTDLAEPAESVQVLATAPSAGSLPARPAAWVLGYALGREGAGLVRIYDRALDAQITSAAMSQVLRVAEHLPSPAPLEVLTATTQDAGGLPVQGQKVVVTGAGGRVVLRTNADGRASVAVAPGGYQVDTPDGSGDAPASVTVAPGSPAEVFRTVKRWDLVASVRAGTSLKRYSASTGQLWGDMLPAGLVPPEGGYGALAAAPDGILYGAGPSGLLRLDVSDGSLVQFPPVFAGADGLQVGLDGKLLVGDKIQGVIGRLDPTNGSRLADFAKVDAGGTLRLDSVAPDGSVYAWRSGHAQRLDGASGAVLEELGVIDGTGKALEGKLLQGPEQSLLVLASDGVRQSHGVTSTVADLKVPGGFLGARGVWSVGPDGDLYLCEPLGSATSVVHRILRFDGVTLARRGVLVQLGQGDSFQPRSLAFVPGSSLPPLVASGDKSTVEVSAPGYGIAGGPPILVTVWVRNELGLPVRGATVKLLLPGGDDVVVQPAPPTGSDGKAVTALSCGRVRDLTIGVIINPGPRQIALAPPVQTRWTVGPPVRLGFLQSPISRTADRPLSPVRVAAFDAYGNVSTLPSVVELRLGKNPTGAILDGGPYIEASSLQYLGPLLRLDRPGVGYTLVVSAEGLASGESKPFDALAAPGFELLAFDGYSAEAINATSGVSSGRALLGPSTDAAVPMALGSDGLCYVAHRSPQEVVRYSPSTGTSHGAFIPEDAHELGIPLALAFGPEGDLYVASYRGEAGGLDASRPEEKGIVIKRFDGDTGAKVRDVVTLARSDQMDDLGLAFGPDGRLYVARPSLRRVECFDLTSGALVGTPVDGQDASQPAPRRLCFGLDGSLLAIAADGHGVYRYDAATGELLGIFVPQWSGGLALPQALLVGPDGLLYVFDGGADQLTGKPDLETDYLKKYPAIRRYDGITGQPVDTLVSIFGRVGLLAFAETTSAVPDQDASLLAIGRKVYVRPGVPRGLRLEGWSRSGAPTDFEVMTGPAHGTLTGTAPYLTYTPEPGYVGADELTFRVAQGGTQSDPAALRLETAQDVPLFTVSDAAVLSGEVASASFLPTDRQFAPGLEVYLRFRVDPVSGTVPDLKPGFTLGGEPVSSCAITLPSDPWFLRTIYDGQCMGYGRPLAVRLDPAGAKGAGKVRLGVATLRIYGQDGHGYFDPKRVASGTITFRSDTLGDVTGDGRLNVADVVLALRVLLGLAGTPEAEVIASADVDCDGKVTIRDAVLLLRACILGEPLKAC